MKKLVSVIIPVYNGELYIENCVRSVINQTYQYLEIIIINDGSIDKTMEICNNMTRIDKRIKLINQLNKGPSAARNVGLNEKKGDYIFFLDSDDWIEETCISNLIQIFEKEKLDIIFFDYFKNYKDCEVKHYTYPESFLYDENNFKLWDMRTITPWGKMYSKECINNIRFDENMRLAEDVDFNYRIYRNVKKAYYIRKCLLHYRILEKSAVHGFDKNIQQKFQYPLKKIASYMKTNNINDLKAYYSFAAISYIVICQNGVVLNQKLTNKEIKQHIKSISKELWIKDLFNNIKYVALPFSRKVIIYCSKIHFYSMMIIAGNVRRRLKK